MLIQFCNTLTDSAEFYMDVLIFNQFPFVAHLCWSQPFNIINNTAYTLNYLLRVTDQCVYTLKNLLMCRPKLPFRRVMSVYT